MPQADTWRKTRPIFAVVARTVRAPRRYRPDLGPDVTGQGLKIAPYRKGRARPDGILCPIGHFDRSGEWADPDGVLAVVEVTSWDADTHARDRVEKPVAYADSGIGVYLLVDREANAVVVHSRPVGGRYLDRSEHPYGEPSKSREPVSPWTPTGSNASPTEYSRAPWEPPAHVAARTASTKRAAIRGYPAQWTWR
jgi:hypothetical protein